MVEGFIHFPLNIIHNYIFNVHFICDCNQKSLFVTNNLTVFYFLFYQPCATSKGQIQPIGESAAGSTRDGSTRRGLLVLQTYARKRTTPDTLDGDADCKKAIMIGNTISFSDCEAICNYYRLLA